jgi:hypothetical protein
MIHSGRCPKCDEPVSAVIVEPVDLKQGGEHEWHGASFCCSHCHTVLGVGLDPLALRAYMVSAVINHIRTET